MAQERQTQPDIGMRLSRFEEGQAFTERTVEQLNDEVVLVNKRLSEAMTRIERLEKRLDRLTGVVSEVSVLETDVQDARPHPDIPHEQGE